MKIEATDKTLSDILKGHYFRIPRFQRPYSWTVENVSDFWDDTINQQGSEYFIGSMVVYRGDKESKDSFGVVDGQQRLTTITMILSSLRDAFRAEGHDQLAQGVHQLIERNNINNEPQYVLDTETSYPYFQEHIQKFGKPDAGEISNAEEEALEKAHAEVRRLIEIALEKIRCNKAIGEEEGKKRIRATLIDMRDKILSLKLIFVILDTEDDAYIIFETLNTRGKDLSVADLVKNHFVRLIKVKTKGVDIAVHKWHELQDILEGSSADLALDVFLHHFWLSTFDYITIKSLFKEFRKKVTAANASSFLDWLGTEAKLYRQIHETSFRHWAMHERDIRASLDALQLFRVKQQVPIVLSVMREFSKDIFKKKDVERALLPIANFHFIFTAVTSQRSSGGISQMYARAARDIYAENDKNKKLLVVDSLVKKLRDKLPTQAEFQANFKNIFYTTSQAKQRGLVKYILARVDGSLRKDAIVDYGQMTIEHIAPQNPPTGQALTPEQYGQLGNLILVPSALNVELGNKTFSEKMELLLKANVPLDSGLANAEMWGHKQIEERTELLSKACYEVLFKI